MEEGSKIIRNIRDLLLRGMVFTLIFLLVFAVLQPYNVERVEAAESESEAVDIGTEGTRDETEAVQTGTEAVQIGTEAVEAVTEALTEMIWDSTENAVIAVVDGTEVSEATEFGDMLSTKDTTPSESEGESNDSKDGILANGHWVVLGVILALIVFIAIWIVMHQKIFPERITLEQTYYEVDGEEMAGEATIEGGKELKGKTARITVRAPEVPEHPELEFGITLEIKPVDYRCMKSFLRRVEVTDITDGTFATAQVQGGSVAASSFVWDETGKCYTDGEQTESSDAKHTEGQENDAGQVQPEVADKRPAGQHFGYTVGSMRTYRLNGVARDGDREMEVELSFILQYK